MLAATVAAYAARAPQRPQEPEKICSVLDENPEWYSAALEAERRWSAPAPMIFAIIWRESKFASGARAPRKKLMGVVPWRRLSTAYGFPQAVDGTWDWYRQSTGRTDAVRTDFGDSTDFVGWYIARSTEILGLSAEDTAAHYLAYHQGHGGFRSGKWRDSVSLQNVAAQVVFMSRRFDEDLTECRPDYRGRLAPDWSPQPKVRPL